MGIPGKYMEKLGILNGPVWLVWERKEEENWQKKMLKSDIKAILWKATAKGEGLYRMKSHWSLWKPSIRFMFYKENSRGSEESGLQKAEPILKATSIVQKKKGGKTKLRK